MTAHHARPDAAQTLNDLCTKIRSKEIFRNDAFSIAGRDPNRNGNPIRTGT